MEPKFQLKKSRTSYLSVDYSHILKDTPRTDYSTTASQVLTPNPSSFSVYSQEPKYKPLVLKEDSKDRILTELEDKIAKLFKVVSNKANQVNKA